MYQTPDFVKKQKELMQMSRTPGQLIFGIALFAFFSRDIENVRKRYRKMTKEELIEKLIQAEQYIAENHENWIVEQFKAFTKE
jgi:hypothetical protein